MEVMEYSYYTYPHNIIIILFGQIEHNITLLKIQYPIMTIIVTLVKWAHISTDSYTGKTNIVWKKKKKCHGHESIVHILVDPSVSRMQLESPAWDNLKNTWLFCHKINTIFLDK